MLRVVALWRCGVVWRMNRQKIRGSLAGLWGGTAPRPAVDYRLFRTKVIIVLDCRSVSGSLESSALLNSANCVYILGQRSVRLIILKQLKQFNLFYAAHISLLSL
jgi:hypothetical protein